MSNLQLFAAWEALDLVEAEAAGWRMAEPHRQAAVAQRATRRNPFKTATRPASGQPLGGAIAGLCAPCPGVAWLGPSPVWAGGQHGAVSRA